MKISPLRAELLHADKQDERHAEQNAWTRLKMALGVSCHKHQMTSNLMYKLMKNKRKTVSNEHQKTDNTNTKRTHTLTRTVKFSYL
jgi:hypothetical protein